MMLLQAGQLGLYRRESIWTSEIPPEMVSGATLWIDGTDTSTLWDNVGFSGGNVTTDGAYILSADNKIFPGTGAETNAVVGEVTLKAPATVSGRSALVFSVEAISGMRLEMDTGLMLTASTKLIFAAVKITAANAPTSAWNTDSVICDESGYYGLHFYNDAGSHSALAYNWDGAEKVASHPITPNEWNVLTMSHQGGQLRLRVNGGGWESVSSGDTTTLAPYSYIGRVPFAVGRAFELAHLAVVKTPQTDAAISAVEHWIANDLGITPWW